MIITNTEITTKLAYSPNVLRLDYLNQSITADCYRCLVLEDNSLADRETLIIDPITGEDFEAIRNFIPPAGVTIGEVLEFLVYSRFVAKDNSFPISPELLAKFQQ
ncbi:MAG: hypothetical protein HY817_01615 [Candidatus Abawacabacteria bacterium]|nr:hypothetical protein [Candidatus Abawacabacteria bacterium]